MHKKLVYIGLSTCCILPKTVVGLCKVHIILIMHKCALAKWLKVYGHVIDSEASDSLRVTWVALNTIWLLVPRYYIHSLDYWLTTAAKPQIPVRLSCCRDRYFRLDICLQRSVSWADTSTFNRWLNLPDMVHMDNCLHCYIDQV